MITLLNVLELIREGQEPMMGDGLLEKTDGKLIGLVEADTKFQLFFFFFFEF